ncbi:Trehalose utilization [Symmachiella dynata]|uniref:DUF1080 domain-containing protein n=1 Tax=Symmachiella dynata TaxID=2527995 RepID=UPI00118CB6B2|nr:family 16 glycoside hydrolase [Symmachiella dynata]QDT50623.1 Trehalose utilization [Symmachiella dynata]
MTATSRRLLVLFLGSLVLWGATLAHAEEPEPGFKSIFNGKDLTGWDGNPKFWSVRDGAITGQTTKENPTKGNTFLIWEGGKVDDFELRLQVKIIDGNSGIQYRSKAVDKWVLSGYQADYEAGEKYSGILYEEKARGILALRGQKVVIGADGKITPSGSVGDPATIQKSIKKEDWNDYTIIAEGNHLIHKINGHVTIDLTDNDAKKRAMQGLLALQLHAGPPMTVQFRNIRLKRLKLAQGKKVVMVAGTPSHAPGHHEFNAGVLLLERCVNEVPGLLAQGYLNGWPKDPTAFDNADTIFLFMDGGSRHPVIQGENLREMHDLMKKGVGLACVHYAVEVPKERGGPEYLDWIGGYYETDYSTNPHWIANVDSLPEHPITRGVKPFHLNDEWYFNIRFPVESDHVQPIVQATPPDDVRRTQAAAEHPGRLETLSWAIERPDGGRGFGFTGGHFHNNWGDNDFRKLVLNAIAWTAGAEVPAEGIASQVDPEELKQNLDKKRK